jgi:hypothetical protein
MPIGVGTQPTSASINNQLTALAQQLRNLLFQAASLSTQVNGTGQGLAFLESVGYGSTANPLNPGSITDAAYALQMVGYLNALSAVYLGGTQATGFNYNNALAVLWNSQ